MAVEVAEEPARERVAGSGRIDDPVERHPRHEEEALVAAHAGAVAALLDHEHAGPARAQLGGADLRFGSPVSMRTSASFSITTSTPESVSSSDVRADSIQ